MDRVMERIKLMDALDRYEMEFDGMAEIQAVDAVARLVVQGRRRDLENRIWFIKHCLDYQTVERVEC